MSVAATFCVSVYVEPASVATVVAEPLKLIAPSWPPEKIESA
jgi:hypothetical protein